MSNFLSPSEISNLRTMQKKSREKRVSDKIKTILLANSGYSYEHIAEVLLLDDATIHRWYMRYEAEGIDGLLADNYLGGIGYLSVKQMITLSEHLINHVYLTAKGK